MGLHLIYFLIFGIGLVSGYIISMAVQKQFENTISKPQVLPPKISKKPISPRKTAEQYNDVAYLTDDHEDEIIRTAQDQEL